jgi:glucokinase
LTFATCVTKIALVRFQTGYFYGSRSGQTHRIEVSRTAITSAVIDGSNNVIDTRTVAIAEGVGVAEQLAATATELQKEFAPVVALGLAVPGLVDRATGRVAFSANVPAHSETDLVSELRNATGLNAVFENDANAAAFGEFHLGAGRGSEDLFYATLGDGVGGAFIFGGEIWRGASGFAGEFGYVTINSEGTRLEDVASSANIIRRTRSRFMQDSTSSLNQLSEEQITLDEIIRAAGDDDDFAQLMLERTGTYVGTGIASVINLLNVERIIVGGEIMQAKQLVLDAIVDRARELAFKPAFDSTTIVEGELGSYAAAIGAALLSSENAD